MKTLVFLSLTVSLLMATPALSQDRRTIDSLSTLLARSDLKQQAHWLNLIGWEYRLAYPDSTLYYCRRAVAAGEREQMFGEVTKALNFMGLAFMYKGNASEAFRLHREALDYALRVSDSTQMAHAYNSLGRLFFTQGDAIKSYDYFYKALTIFRKINDTKGTGYVYQSLGHLYQRQHDWEKALEMLYQALQIREDLPDLRGQLSTLQKIAHIQEKKGDLEEAYATFQRARTISEVLDDKISITEIDLGIANMSLRQQDYPMAEQYSRRALVAIGLSENEPLLAAIYLTLAKIHYAQSELRQANLYLRKVIQSSQQTGNLQARKESYDYLSRIYERQQEYQQALAFHQQYLSLKDSLYNADMARTLERLEGQLALEEKESEYALLKTNEAKNRVIIQQQKMWDIAKSITLVVITVLLGVLFLGYRRIRKKNRLLLDQKGQIEEQHEKIYTQNKELHQKNNLLAQLDQEKDMLINVVAHDLKAPLNRLVSMADLAMLPETEPNERDMFLQMIKDVSYDGITLTKDLLDSNYTLQEVIVQRMPVRLKTLFEHLLTTYYAQAHEKLIEIRVAVAPSLQVHTDETYLTRILDNLLSNAIKFSPVGTSVYLEAYTEKEGAVKILVRDEGPGFSREDKQQLYQKFKRLSAQPTQGESSHGLGLAIVKTLVTHVGATIELISEVQRGSEFVVTFPAYEEVV